MYKLIQKNQKKLLAVFMTLLMIVFILPSATKNNMSRGDLAVGKVGSEAVYGRELGEAKDELRLLEQHMFEPLYALGEGAAIKQFSQHEDLYVVLQKEALQQGISVSSQQAEKAARDSIELQDVPKDVIDEQIVPAVGHFLLVQAAYDRAAASAKMSSPMLKYLVSQDAQRFGLNLVEFRASEYAATVAAPTPEQIRQRYEIYADVLPSRPNFFSTEPATIGYKLPDRVKLQYVELPRDAVTQSVLKELTPDEIYRLDEEAYRYYADPKNASDFAIAPSPATSPATGPATIPTSNATADAATQPASRKLSVTQPATGPTTKPFAVVREDLRKKLLGQSATNSTSDIVVSIRDRIATRSKQVRTALRDQLDKAYADWANAAASPTSGQTLASTTAPATQPVQGYADLDFLDQFASQFEAQYHIRPLVHSLSKDWLNREELANLPDIGNSKAASLPFPSYVLRDLVPPPQPVAPAGPPTPSSLPSILPSTTAPIAPATEPARAVAATSEPTTWPSYTAWRPLGMGLHPFEPTEVLLDSDDNAYVARLTAYDPEHKPPLQEVTPEIIKDLTAAAALQRAHEEAAKVLASATTEAKLSDKDNSPTYPGGLPAAAGAAGRTLLRPGPFPGAVAQADFSGIGAYRYLQVPIPGYDIKEPTDKIAFWKATQSLMKQAAPANRHPAALADLRTEQKVLVLELGPAVLPWTPGEQFPMALEMSHVGEQNLVAGSAGLTPEMQLIRRGGPSPTSLATEWFDYDDALARAKYVKAEKKS